MKGTQHDLPTWLARNPFPPLWIVTGDEPLLIEEAADAIRAAAHSHGFTQCEREVIDHSKRLAALNVTTESCSLFAEQRLLQLRWQAPPSSREESTWLVALAQRPPEATVTLVILPPLEWRARKTPWYQTLCQQALVIETTAPSRSQLPQWWHERLARQGQHASRTLLDWLATATEGNLLAACQYLALLALLFPAGELPEGEVRRAISEVARFDPFDLRLAILERQIPRALRLIAGLKNEGVAEPLVLWAITAALRALARASQLGANASYLSIDTLAHNERLFTPAEKAALRAATSLPVSLTRRWLLSAAQLDQIAKGVAPGDFWQEAERLLFALRPLSAQPPNSHAFSGA
jgi:DNA polymerase-3 subunit delta